ncbi:hypothetical protein [Candidatus Hecatella orcuttiae]|uniref:hypothetical protein n=1 Tax=Candidatus Hecatella orcuttiae TaxID=1935119 RepID=UPI002867C4B3|nr:hypothetical protein [Candidatus Hecatella orcuttiae]
MEDKCPGSAFVKIETTQCPKCGEEVELFSDEYKTKCPNCGETVFRDLASCIDWCPYSQKCLEDRQKYQSKS